MTIKASDIGWASVVALCCVAGTCTVFAVALVLALLCEFIVTGGIGETVDDSFVRTGGRICGATSLLAFVVGFGVVTWQAGRDDEELSEWLETKDAELFLGHESDDDGDDREMTKIKDRFRKRHSGPGRGEEPDRPWRRGP